MDGPQVVTVKDALGALELRLTAKGADKITKAKRQEIESAMFECLTAVL